MLHAHDPLTLKWADALGIPRTIHSADAGSPELLSLIQPIAHQPYFLVRDHGFVAAGPTVEDTGHLAVSIHEKAKLMAI